MDRIKKKVKRYLRKKKLEYIQEQQRLREEYNFPTPPPHNNRGPYHGNSRDDHDKRVRFNLPLEATPPTLMTELRVINLERTLAEQRLTVESLTKANQECLQQVEQYKTLLMKESRKVQESRQDYMDLAKSKKKEIESLKDRVEALKDVLRNNNSEMHKLADEYREIRDQFTTFAGD